MTTKNLTKKQEDAVLKSVRVGCMSIGIDDHSPSRGHSSSTMHGDAVIHLSVNPRLPHDEVRTLLADQLEALARVVRSTREALPARSAEIAILIRR